MMYFDRRNIIDQCGISEQAKDSAIAYVAQLADLNCLEICAIGSSFDTAHTIDNDEANTWTAIPFPDGGIQSTTNPNLFEWDNDTATLTIKSYRGKNIIVFASEDVYGDSTTNLALCAFRVNGKTAENQVSRAAIAQGTYYSYRSNLACLGGFNPFSEDEHVSNLVYPTLTFEQYIPETGKFVAPRLVVIMLS